MHSKIFDKTTTSVQFICIDGTVITFEKYYTFSTSKMLNNNYRHLHLNQEESSVIELINNKQLKQYLLYLYAKYTKDYFHSYEISYEDAIVLWYVDDFSSTNFTGYVISLNIKNYTVIMFPAKNIHIYMDIGITKDEFNTITVLHELDTSLAYPAAIEIAKQYQLNTSFN